MVRLFYIIYTHCPLHSNFFLHVIFNAQVTGSLYFTIVKVT